MVDYTNTLAAPRRCSECGAKEPGGLTCYDLFGYPLAWEHEDPALYALHFWLVSCYMIQHPSYYTEEGYRHMIQLFKDAYDHKWDTPYILRRNRELVGRIGKITSPIPDQDRVRKFRQWSMTIEDIYLGGEQHAIANIALWKDRVRGDLG
ncbi:DUF5946 family protein [Paenibacillus sp. 1P07SE]|uniref:DUF5946 family protein n=1 Tax=Paenibacillus sp. 1P07SE TaxID=3132209 RepID=UPI0039A565FA